MQRVMRSLFAFSFSACLVALAGCACNCGNGRTPFTPAFSQPHDSRLQFRIGAADGDTTSAADEFPDPYIPDHKIRILKTVYLDERSIASATFTTTDEKLPAISIVFTPAGREFFANLTRSNVGRPLAIFFDGKLLTAPRINTEISGGKGIITMKRDTPADEVKKIAEAINSVAAKTN